MLMHAKNAGHGRTLNGKSHREIKSVCAVIPTYNEALNIKLLIETVYRKWYSCTIKAELHVLVVDDNSPDGTAEIVKECQKRNPYVHLLWRAGKEGLGAAYISGMQYAMEMLNPDVIMEM